METVTAPLDGVQLDRYRAANAALVGAGVVPEVVFIGDSITELWTAASPALFAPTWINRGIGGQTTTQIMARFDQDAIALNPRVVHLMSGINDLADIGGPIAVDEVAAMLATMARRAVARGQRVLLASVLPAAYFLWAPYIGDAAQRVARLNRLLRGIAAEVGATYVDYATPLDDGHGGMREDLAFDGVHPTVAGYTVMTPIAQHAIRAALAHRDEAEPPPAGHGREMHDHSYDIRIATLDAEGGIVRGTIVNRSGDAWERGAGAGELKLGLRILAGDGADGQVHEARGTPLPERLLPDVEVPFEAALGLEMLRPGLFTVEVGLLREERYWFFMRGVPAWRSPLMIVKPRAAPAPAQILHLAPPHPYEGLPAWRFWKTGVVAQRAGALGPTVAQPFAIAPADRLATAGSCFAQHIAKRLQSSFRFVQTEPPPPAQESYFSANYGNIYSARQLHQLLLRAYGLLRPRDIAWQRPDGRYVDPFRPNLYREGFETEDAVVTARDEHLRRVREVFERSDVFVFTLGLTEAWINEGDGAVLTVPPGVVARAAGAGPYAFVNFTPEEIAADMDRFVADVRLVNPALRIVLTVSPVPIIATYEDRHVLVSNGYSKSALRVAADAVVRRNADVAYFPSYELITSPAARGCYYAEGLRSVTPEGVTDVMTAFAAAFLDPAAAAAPETRTREVRADDDAAASFRADRAKLQDVLCDEDLLDTTGPDAAR